MTSGEWVGCFGLTEPDYGSNPVYIIGMKRQGDHYLQFSKNVITNGTTWMVIVLAKLDGVIRGFTVLKRR